MADQERTPPAAADAASALDELQELIGFHVSLANTAIKAHFQAKFGHLRLTQKQIAILWLIGGCPGIIQVELARLLRVKRATMSAMVTVLSVRGLVARQGSGGVDARHVPLGLTAEGKALLVEARRAIDLHEQWVKGFFSPDERRTIAALMRRVYQGRE